MAGRTLLGKRSGQAAGARGQGWTWRARSLRASRMTMDAPTKEILARIDGEAMLEQVLDTVATRVQEIAGMLVVKIGPTQTYEQIQRRAAEQLNQAIAAPSGKERHNHNRDRAA